MGSSAAPLSHDGTQILDDVGLIGFWQADFVSGEIDVGPAFLAFYGVVVPAGSRPTVADVLKRVHPDDLHIAGPDRLKAVGPDKVGVVKYRIINGEGEIRWVLCRAVYKLGPRGELLSGRGLAFDVTASQDAAAVEAAGPVRQGDPLERLCGLLLESVRLAEEIDDPSLTHALSLSLMMAGRRLSRDLLHSTGGMPH